MSEISQNDTSKRWWMLILLSLTLMVLTINWFDIAAAFPQIGAQFHLDVAQLSLLIGVFIFGFAVCHIPAGILASHFGVKNVLLVGLVAESVFGILCAIAPNFTSLIFFRLLTGIGASLIVGMSLSLITSWFRGSKELALALGISAGGCFTLGQIIALSGWISVVKLFGWEQALIFGGVFGLVVFVLCLVFLHVPKHEEKLLSAGNLDWKVIGRIISNRDLLFVGLSFFGVYGAGLLTAQLLSTYLTQTYHFSENIGGLFSALFVAMAIPGSILGGFLADRSNNLRAVFVVPWIIMGLSLCLFPFFGLAGVWMMVIVSGTTQQFGFSAWSSIPGRYGIRPQDIATAEGLLLTAGGIGGFIIPVFFGLLESNFGFPIAFVFGGGASIVFALIGFAAREPLHSDIVPSSASEVNQQSLLSESVYD